MNSKIEQTKKLDISRSLQSVKTLSFSPSPSPEISIQLVSPLIEFSSTSLKVTTNDVTLNSTLTLSVQEENYSADEVVYLCEKESNYFGKQRFNEWKIIPKEFLTSGHINVIQSLMYEKYKYSFKSGFIHPSRFSPMKKRDFYLNPESIHESAFVTVLSAGEHWVTVTNHNPFYTHKINEAGLSIWFIYDCLNQPQFYLNKIAPALKRLNTNSECLQVFACKMPKPSKISNCGLFALGYAIAICEEKQPSKLLFKEISMRENFNIMLETQELRQFDNIEDSENASEDYKEYYVELRDVPIKYGANELAVF